MRGETSAKLRGNSAQRRFGRVRRRSRKCRCSGAPATYQRSLHYILAHYPITASSIQFCLLCCQPEPIPRLLNCQGITACAMKTLQTTCLIGVSHRHAMQDLVSSATLHHPDLREAIGSLTLPASMSILLSVLSSRTEARCAEATGGDWCQQQLQFQVKSSVQHQA